jgi:small subunit ribosomal protein S2
MLPKLSIKTLLEAGVHFGHQSRKWNPKMARYIHAKRNDIHIMDLAQTVRHINKARDLLRDVAKKGGNILFVSTKRQAQDIIEEHAIAAGVYYVCHRWLGGTLTNFKTIRQRVSYLKKLESMVENGDMELLGKKERARRMRELANLTRFLKGIKEMESLPNVVFLVDPNKEKIAVHECRKLGIPIVAITDTNCDPQTVDYVIPGNDDAIRSIKIIVSYLTEAILEGKETAAATEEKEAVN